MEGWLHLCGYRSKFICTHRCKALANWLGHTPSKLAEPEFEAMESDQRFQSSHILSLISISWTSEWMNQRLLNIFAYVLSEHHGLNTDLTEFIVLPSEDLLPLPSPRRLSVVLHSTFFSPPCEQSHSKVCWLYLLSSQLKVHFGIIWRHLIIELPHFLTATILSKTKKRASLVAQWLGICLSMQGIRVRALFWEDPTCCRATKPVRHNYWACALESVSHNYWAHVPQLLKPAHLEPCSTAREATAMRSPRTAMKSTPCSALLEKALAQQRRPNAAKNE